MCLVWTVKYNICGCICEKESIYCTPYQFCWGPRVIIFHSNLQTCEDCWQRGDKRVNEGLAKILNRLADEERQENRRRDEQSRSKHRTKDDSATTEADENCSEASSRREDSEGAQAEREDADFDTEQNIQNNMYGAESEKSRNGDAGIGGHKDHQSQTLRLSSRPNTPVRDIDRDFDPDYTPPWLLSIEQNCDLTRVCDPVRVSSISRNYRAPPRRTDWYALEGKFSVTPCFVHWFAGSDANLVDS